MATMIGKISMRTIKTTPAKQATEGESTRIAIVFGQATGIKEVVDKARGDVYQALSGTFAAKNEISGEEFQSGLLYLPAGIHAMVESAVKTLDGETKSVNFALGINVVTASNPAGYSYEAVNLIPAMVVDPLDEMRKAIEASAPAKALPAETAAKTDAKKK